MELQMVDIKHRFGNYYEARMKDGKLVCFFNPVTKRFRTYCDNSVKDRVKNCFFNHGYKETDEDLLGMAVKQAFYDLDVSSEKVNDTLKAKISEIEEIINKKTHTEHLYKRKVFKLEEVN